jgi:hypothetical protein
VPGFSPLSKRRRNSSHIDPDFEETAALCPLDDRSRWHIIEPLRLGGKKGYLLITHVGGNLQRLEKLRGFHILFSLSRYGHEQV